MSLSKWCRSVSPSRSIPERKSFERAEASSQEDFAMKRSSGSKLPRSPGRAGRFGVAAVLVALAGLPISLPAQTGAQTGSISGNVVDEQGAGLPNVQVTVEGLTVGAQTRADGGYLLARVPVGARTLRARLIGYRPQTASVTVTAGQTISQDFTMTRDPLQLEDVVVTGTQTPRTNLEASVAVTTLTASEIEVANPRSTTEMLRLVPGFTRVESSGGEVNQNITMRGILNEQFVAFLEDGMPVFPTMHTYFMNADNLFRFDTNIEQMEVVRGGSSPLFGSNTPGAIVNFINKSGGPEFAGTMRATGGTQGLGRYDLNINGPFGEDWRFNVGGFYRYDHGVRDPGFPGIRGGQVKGNITRLLDNGYLRFSVKYLDDRNLFITPLPFTNRNDPEYVPGFGNYGSMSTAEGVDITVPTPNGTLTLPLDNGLRTKAIWFTADVLLDLSDEWQLRNTAQVMQNDQQWNAIPSSGLFSAADFITAPAGSGGLGFPAGSTGQYFFTNHLDAAGNRLPFDTPNGLVAAPGQWHIDKPISAVQNQLTIRRTFGPHAISLGGYFANYTQDNRWFFTNILTDVRDIPRFLDLVVTPAGGGAPINVTQNGFRNFISDYANGTGQSSIVSGVIGAELQLMDRLRADLGFRVEFNDYVQSSERKGPVDLDANPATPFNNITFGNNTFKHFSRDITDWSASLGLNFSVNNNVSLYGVASRGYKMPALDDFLNATAQEQVDLFDAQEVQSVEGGVKYAVGQVGFAVNGFYTKRKNIVGQGAITDPVTGAQTWRITFDPESRSYGAELELFVSPIEGLQLASSGTLLKAEQGPGIDSLVGVRLAGAPTHLGNVLAVFAPAQARGIELKADLHWVGSRFTESPRDRITGAKLPSYAYVNFGAGYAFPNSGVRLNVDVLNAFQSKGLEEGNPRIVTGVGELFLARPILPRRVQASIQYDFGAGARE
ncbi:MAG TPA: TonB-dependent receptor [Gemmatimonadales bacterium]|nr:TonB-dependent receptor [Gemmatimonadales bacterium]